MLIVFDFTILVNHTFINSLVTTYEVIMIIFIFTLLKGKFKQNEIKKTTGIPRTFLQLATAETPGAKMCKGMYLLGNHTFCADKRFILDSLKINDFWKKKVSLFNEILATFNKSASKPTY